jgi:hypothetical protein
MLTARESSMGSSGGTTEVTIMMQCSTSLLQAPQIKRSAHSATLSSGTCWYGAGA